MPTELFGSGGDSVWMQPPFYCDYGSNIHLGERVYFNLIPPHQTADAFGWNIA